MSATINNNKILTGKPVKTFFSFSLPNVAAMLCIASASVIDGYFVGNFIGPDGLAAVTLAMPFISLFYGLVIMLCIGGVVVCGKRLGEGNIPEASNIFSMTLLAALVPNVILAVLGFLFHEPLLGAITNDDIAVAEMAGRYLQTFFCFVIFSSTSFCLTQFARVDGRPYLSSAMVITSAVLNIILDWLFLAKFGWGIQAAAAATGIAYSVSLLLLPLYLRPGKQSLRLRWPRWDGRAIFRMCANGFSELINEVSGGFFMLVINFVLIRRVGTYGVAAFAVVNYIMMMELIAVYGIGDSIGPLVSTCFGAKDSRRIKLFLRYGIASVACIGAAAAGLVLFRTEWLVEIFLDSGAEDAHDLAMRFAAFFWPAFLFNGTSIVLTAYFTAMHKALASIMTALLRTLVLPVILLIILPVFLGDIGIIVAIVVAEAITLLIAISLFLRLLPQKLCKSDSDVMCQK